MDPSMLARCSFMFLEISDREIEGRQEIKVTHQRACLRPA